MTDAQDYQAIPCPTCHALVPLASMDDHKGWHSGDGTAAPANPAERTAAEIKRSRAGGGI